MSGKATTIHSYASMISLLNVLYAFNVRPTPQKPGSKFTDAMIKFKVLDHVAYLTVIDDHGYFLIRFSELK